MDTDEAIPGPSSAIVFYISDAKALVTPEGCLAALRSSWEGHDRRFKDSEEEFLASLHQYLLTIAGARIGQVRTWLEQNTTRFGKHSDVQTLLRRFDELAKELKGHILLCGVSCGSCSLSCLKGRQHDGAHDCCTTHECPSAREFKIDDEPKGDDADLLRRIRGLYRLLDLISEQGAGMSSIILHYRDSIYPHSQVDKVIIAQESVARFVNDICPGAYTSMTKVSTNRSKSGQQTHWSLQGRL